MKAYILVAGFILVVLSAVLAACGGGGGDDETDDPKTPTPHVDCKATPEVCK